ncbi:MAG: hypothetical protein B6D68_02875, partial [spirochete symbiont of Stewartia floridana]
MKKAIFILGCGVMQIPALRLAKDNGWMVCAADGDFNAPGRQYCDEFHHVDLKDARGLIAAAETIRNGRGPDGVFTAGTDFSLSAALVAEALNLPGHGAEAARRATDKVLMRETFRAADIPSPSFVEITGDISLQQQLDSVPGPWVVKPVDSMGARGVIKIDNPTDLAAAIDTACSFSRSGRALVETFMEGPEFSLDALVTQGRLIRCGLADRIIVYPPCFIEIGHTIPSKADIDTADTLWKIFEDGVHALGLTHGAAKGDVKLTPQGVMIGEIAARLSGGYMSGWTYPAASGIEPTLSAMRLALGMETGDLVPSLNLICAERALVGIDGTVHRFDGRDDAMKSKGVKEVFLRCRPGDAITFPRNNVEKAANVIAVGTTHAEASERAMEALRRLRLVLNPADAVTGTYLDSFADFPPDVFAPENYFDGIWQEHPPLPSRGCPQNCPWILI